MGSDPHDTEGRESTFPMAINAVENGIHHGWSSAPSLSQPKLLLVVTLSPGSSAWRR